MRTTGIIRRVDELGRVVIPSEMRRTMRLKVGSELELFTENDSIIIKRFSSVKNIESYAKEFAGLLARTTGCTILFCDAERVIATSGECGKEYYGRALSRAVTEGFDSRSSRVFTGEGTISLTGEENLFKCQVLVPLTTCGDVLGGIIALTDKEDAKETALQQTELCAECFTTVLQ